MCGNDYSKQREAGQVDNGQCATSPGHCMWGATATCADPIDPSPLLNHENCYATDASACAAVELDGAAAAACAAAGACSYTPPSGRVIASEGCYSTAAEYCNDLNEDPSRMANTYVEIICGNQPHPEWDIPGGCTYTPADSASGTAASCAATVITSNMDYPPIRWP